VVENLIKECAISAQTNLSYLYTMHHTACCGPIQRNAVTNHEKHVTTNRSLVRYACHIRGFVK